MREICMSGSMSGVWKRSQGRTSEAPPDERGGQQICLAYRHCATLRLYQVRRTTRLEPGVGFHQSELPSDKSSHRGSADDQRCGGRAGGSRRQIMHTAIPSFVGSAEAPWNKGRLIGQKRPLRPKEVWAIRIRLQLEQRRRDLALFNLAIDSKLRGCDLVRL